MSLSDDWADALAGAGAFRAGPSESALVEAERALECTLPPEIRAFYGTHDGQLRAGRTDLRWMTLAEAIEIRGALRDLRGGAADFRTFWADDQGNYVGCFVKGPLEGRLAMLDHDETDLSPVFESPSSFRTALRARPLTARNALEVPNEYPRTEPHPSDDADEALAHALIALASRANDDVDRQWLLFSALNVCPTRETTPLAELADDDNMYVQERACKVIGIRKLRPFVPILERVARDGTHNGKIAALRALRSMGGREAPQALARLRRELGAAWDIYTR